MKHEKLVTKVVNTFKTWCETNDESESIKIELDNLDEAKLKLTEFGVVVENEHGTELDLEDLSKEELEIFLYLFTSN